MKTKFIIGLVLICILIIVVIGFVVSSFRIQYPDLTDDAIAFYVGEYIDENDSDSDDAGYLTIEYNGRTYMPYGTLKGFLKERDIDKCIGYIVQTENSSSVPNENDKDTRIYTLTEDLENNFLMDYYIGTTFMNQPSFYRAIDTKEQDINIPDYIDSLDYDFWK